MTASAAPSGSPKTDARTTAVKLMLSDKDTIATRLESPDRISWQAAAKASRRSCTGEPLEPSARSIHHIRCSRPIWYLTHIRSDGSVLRQLFPTHCPQL